MEHAAPGANSEGGIRIAPAKRRSDPIRARLESDDVFLAIGQLDRLSLSLNFGMAGRQDDHQRIADDVKLGRNVRINGFVSLYGCSIGDETKIGPFVEIQKGAKIGARCKISSHSFICEGVTIENEVFVGHGVVFINDRYPRATNANGQLQTEADWNCQRTLIKKGASIGSNATVLGGITIGDRAIVGAGSVVTKDVPANATVAGNPARILSRQSTTNRKSINAIRKFNARSISRS